MSNVSALRTNPLGENPPVSKTVAGASALLRDLQSVTARNGQLARVASDAAEASKLITQNPDGALLQMIDQMKELVCSYAYTYDSSLSPRSETARSQAYRASQLASWEKDPQKLIAPLVAPSTVPASPGNLYYMALHDDASTFNPQLRAQYVALKAANPNRPDSEIISSLMPRYAVVRSNISEDLLSRWEDVLTLSEVPNQDPVTFPQQTSAFETLAIAGFQNLLDYKLFMLVRKLDTYLKQFTLAEAQYTVDLFMEAGFDGNHYGVWLAYGKTLLAPQEDTFEGILGYLAGHKSATTCRALWDWLAAPFVINSSWPDSDYLPPQSRIAEIANLSRDYVTKELMNLQVEFGLYGTTGDEARRHFVEQAFARWKSKLEQVGEVLGLDGVLLIAALTALERCKIAVAQHRADDELELLAAEGFKLASYMHNAGPLTKAFQALKEK